MQASKVLEPALVLVDLQSYFFKAINKLRDALDTKLRRSVPAILNYARTREWYIIHVITSYGRDKLDWPVAWRSSETIWCLENTDEVKIIPEATPHYNEPTIVKKRYSAFYQTNLDALLRKRGLNRIVLCGVSTDVCIRCTVLDAYNRDYEIFIPRECTAAQVEDDEQSLRYLRRFTRAKICQLQDILDGHML